MEELCRQLAAAAVRRLVLLSPHADDIALAIGGCVTRLAHEHECHLLTVFSRSAHAPGCPGLVTEDEITAQRCHEDQQYAAAVGLGQRALGFPDTSILGYHTRAELRGSYRDLRFADVCRALVAAASEIEPDLVLAPLALWGHVDHRIVFEASRQTTLRQIPTLYYEDLPYAWYLKEEELRRTVQERLGRDATPILVDITGYREQKHSGLRIYQSQLDQHFLQRDERVIFDYGQRLCRQPGRYGERLWSKASQASCDTPK